MAGFRGGVEPASFAPAPRAHRGEGTLIDLDIDM